MKQSLRYLAAFAAFSSLVVADGCKKPMDQNGNFKTAINTYYQQWPVCLWPDPIQLPQQHSKDDAAKVMPFDALVDQGLMTRTPIEKTKLLVLKTEANSYDLTDKGRANWTPDTTHPGFGNFCYAHRKVQDIQGNTPAGMQMGATTVVTYTWTLGDIKGWAEADETQNAFPDVRNALVATNHAKTTLVLTADGWKVQDGGQPPQRRATDDSGVVQ